MESKPKPKSKPFVEQFDTIVAFLTLEAIALVCFGIGGFVGIKLLEVLGFYVGLCTIPFIRLNYSRADAKRNLKFLIPLGILFVLMGFSAFFFRYYGGFGISSFLYSLIEVLGLAGFFLLGFGIRHVPCIKKEYVLYAFLGGLTLYCLIVGFYSLVRYGPFYTAIYKGLYYYYQGAIFTIDTETKALIGFEFFEVSLKYGGIAGVMLASSGAGLFFLSPKKDKRRFFILLSMALVGLLYLAIIPHLWGLLTVAGVAIVALVYWLIRRLVAGKETAAKKVRFTFTIVFGVLCAAVVVGIFLLLLENRIGLYHKIFESAFHRVPESVQRIFDAVNDVVYGNNVSASLHRIDFGSLLFGFSKFSSELHGTRVMTLNVLWENGLIAMILFLALCFYGIHNSRKYLASEEGDLDLRVSVVMVLLALFVYMNLFADEFPTVHGNATVLFSQSNHFLAAMFLLGFSFVPLKAKEVVHG